MARAAAFLTLGHARYAFTKAMNAVDGADGVRLHDLRHTCRNPRAVDTALEDKIVRLRKTLGKQGYDAGAATIAEHLARDPGVAKVPAVSTIWGILSRRGFVTPQPHKRPRSAW